MTKFKLFLLSSLLSISLLSGGCAQIDGMYTSVASFFSASKTTQTAINTTQVSIGNLTDEQSQIISSSVYEATEFLKAEPKPDIYTNGAESALQVAIVNLPAPSIDSIKHADVRFNLALTEGNLTLTDSQRADIQTQLANSYQADIVKSNTLVAQLNTDKLNLQKLETQEKVEQTQAMDKMQQALNSAQQKEKAAEDEKVVALFALGGMSLIIIGSLITVFSPMKASGVELALIGIAISGLGLFFASQYFLWICSITFILLILCGGIYFYNLIESQKTASINTDLSSLLVDSLITYHKENPSAYASFLVVLDDQLSENPTLKTSLDARIQAALVPVVPTAPPTVISSTSVSPVVIAAAAIKSNVAAVSNVANQSAAVSTSTTSSVPPTVVSPAAQPVAAQSVTS